MTRFLTLLAVAGLSAGVAHAETLGTITGTWDGSERSWFITVIEGESQSAHNDAARVVETFTLWGNPEEDDLASVKNVVSLDFSVMTGAKGKQALNPALYVLENGFNDRWDGSADGQTEIKIETFVKTDASVHVTGTIHATPAKDGETRPFDGTFDVTFPRD